jgi:hypothetical protein
VRHEVQERALGDEQRAKRPLQIHDHGALFDSLTVEHANVNAREREPNRVEHHERNWSAADNANFSGDDLRARPLARTNRRFGCDVRAEAKVFVERRVDEATDLERVES